MPDTLGPDTLGPDTFEPPQAKETPNAMRKTLLALAVALVPIAGAVPAPGLAADPPPGEAPPDVMDEALERVLDALRFVLRAIPQYEMPEVLPNGDIIIRRIPPEPEPAPAPEPPPEDPDHTRT